MNKIFIWASNVYEESGYVLDLDSSTFFTNCKFRILGEMGYIKYDI
jgi:hypothetical protein